MKNVRLIIVLSIALVLCPQLAAFAESISVEDAWVRQPPPSSRLTAGYLTIHNMGASADKLVKVSTPLAARVEVHETVIDEKGTASMHKVDEVVIQPGEAVKFAPGGLHLMIMGLREPIAAGGKFPIEFSFKEGGAIKVEAEIRGKTPNSPKNHEHNHHH